MRKIILHIPHSSTIIPIIDGYILNKKLINEEIIKLTDWHTEDLFYSQTEVSIIAPFSRIFCDVERFSDDEKEEMSKFGMGVLYETFDNGNILRNVTPELRKNILTNYYWKHHTELNKAVSESLKKENECLIVDCHSFPNTPLNRTLNKRENRPDFNIGTDSFHTPPKLIVECEKYFENLGYSIGIDWPYSGSIVPMDYYQKDKRVSSIMLEVNRKLYLEEGTNKKSDKYEKTKDVVQSFLEWLKTLVT